MDDDRKMITDLSADDPEAEQALKDVFFKYANPLIQFARRFSVSKESAEDVVQNVFLALWCNRRSLRIDGTLASYLYAAVRNQSLNQIRHSKTILDGEQQLRINAPDHPAEIDQVEYEQLRRSIQDAVNTLPEQCRRIFLLSRLNGLTYSQIAKALDISVKTVETQMGRALKHIRSSIAIGLAALIILKISRPFL